MNLIPRDFLVSYEIEVTIENTTSQGLPRTTKRQFDTFDRFMDYLVFTQINEYTLISLSCRYQDEKKFRLDILTGKLYIQNSVNLLPLEGLRVIVGMDKFINEIRMEFTE